MEKDYKQAAKILKALADETRLRIIEILSGGEQCACDILESFSITQPTLSHHMKVLTESGLVEGRRDGAWMRYTLKTEAFSGICGILSNICATKMKQKETIDHE